MANQPRAVRRHFHGLREAIPHLRAVALFDRFDAAPPDLRPVAGLVWRRREIESYLCTRATLESYAASVTEADVPGPLFAGPEVERRVGAMREAIDRTASALEQLDRGSPWGPDLMVNDDFLTPLFRAYLGALGLPTDLMTKKSFYELAEHVALHELDPEVGEKLDAIAAVAASAMPADTWFRRVRRLAPVAHAGGSCPATARKSELPRCPRTGHRTGDGVDCARPMWVPS